MEKNNLKKIVIIMAVFIFTAIPIFAGYNSGGELGAFIRLGVDAKTSALGKAFNANEQTSNAAFYNPAKLIFSNKGSFSALLTKPYGEVDGISHNAIGGALPFIKSGEENPQLDQQQQQAEAQLQLLQQYFFFKQFRGLRKSGFCNWNERHYVIC